MHMLILYATRRNSTAEVAAYLSNILREYHLQVTVANVENFAGDIKQFDGYLFGTSIYNGMWLKSLANYVRRCLPDIGQKPVWGWAMCIRILEPDGKEHVYKNYLPDRLLKKINLQDYNFFGGKFYIEDIDYTERWTLSIRYDGKTPPTDYNDDYRDWEAIGAWGHQVAKQIRTIAEKQQ